MSKPCALCHKVSCDPMVGQPFCNACEESMLPANLCCDVCNIRRPTKVCSCRFPLPLLCEECIDAHIAKCGPEAHQLHPLCLYISIKSREDLLLYSNRCARIEYIKEKLADSSLALIERAQSELLGHVQRLREEIEDCEKAAAEQIDLCRKQLVDVVNRLNTLRYYWKEQPENLYDHIALSDSSISSLIQSHIDFSCFRYGFTEEVPHITSFFHCTVAIPSVPEPPPPCEEPSPPISRSASISSLCIETGNHDDLVMRFSALLPFRSLPHSPLSVFPTQPLPPVHPKCVHCLKAITDSLHTVTLSCGHDFHDKECFFAYLRDISTNFATEYRIACPQCLSVQEDSRALVLKVFKHSEFLERVDRVRQTVCCLCGNADSTTRWKCPHRLCAMHKDVRRCPICKNKAELLGHNSTIRYVHLSETASSEARIQFSFKYTCAIADTHAEGDYVLKVLSINTDKSGNYSMEASI